VSMQNSWLDSECLLGELAISFKRLMMSDESLTSPDLFDHLRDKMRDSLATTDAMSFPRYGLHFAAVSKIMEVVFPNNMPALMCILEGGTSHVQDHIQVLNFALPSLCSAANWIVPDNGWVSLQDWLLAFLQKESHKASVSIHGQSQSPPPKVVLQYKPAVLFFEVVSTTSCTFMPSVTLTIPSHGMDAIYDLRAIVYSGNQHFTARMIFSGQTWNYDGRLNSGCPIACSARPSESNYQYLSHFDGRAAHIFVYVLQ
jgi:hypothetical protein